jgi:hypothetical protein
VERTLNFNKISILELFFESMEEVTGDKLKSFKMACPYCCAQNPSWSYYDSYKRYLISFENGKSVAHSIKITRIECSSCKHPHAILPEFIIPYKSYSLLFILRVLRDYFSKVKINALCEKYNISATMIYEWKKLFLLHKELWLGILENICQNAMDFLSKIPVQSTSKDLENFFKSIGYSFLQGIRKTAKLNSG